jgi:hypothetical protein
MTFVPSRTKFSEHLVGYNGLDKKGFEEWLFFPGMLFNATDKWWGDKGARGKPHEGLDLALYRDKNGKNHGLDESIKIPVMYEGKVVTIINDFIGKTLCVAHNICNDNENVLFSIYGHINPYDDIAEGTLVGEGRVIATITELHKKKAIMLPHLHISVAWVPKSLSHENLNWGTISDPKALTLLNPIDFIAHGHTVLGHD